MGGAPAWIGWNELLFVIDYARRLIFFNARARGSVGTRGRESDVRSRASQQFHTQECIPLFVFAEPSAPSVRNAGAAWARAIG